MRLFLQAVLIFIVVFSTTKLILLLGKEERKPIRLHRIPVYCDYDREC